MVAILEKNPLITFAVITYNQEKYIRETLKGVFAQRYPCMEIIISDDCSTDTTFEIIRQMVSQYQGPHHIYAIKQEKNLGTVNHVIDVARRGRGNLLVLNAGDDISHPERTEELVRHWQKTGAVALSSFHDEISEAGELLRSNCSFPISKTIQKFFRESDVALKIDGYIQSVPGFTGAYERNFWSNLPLSHEKLLIEDGLASIILNIRGSKIERVKKSLISYRLLGTSLSVRQTTLSRKNILSREEKINVSAKNIIGIVDYLLDYLDKNEISVEKEIINELINWKSYGLLLRDFWGEPFIKRFRRLKSIKSADDLRFIFPRIFGIAAYVLSKQIILLFKFKAN